MIDDILPARDSLNMAIMKQVVIISIAVAPLLAGCAATSLGQMIDNKPALSTPAEAKVGDASYLHGQKAAKDAAQPKPTATSATEPPKPAKRASAAPKQVVAKKPGPGYQRLETRESIADLDRLR